LELGNDVNYTPMNEDVVRELKLSVFDKEMKLIKSGKIQIVNPFNHINGTYETCMINSSMMSDKEVDENDKVSVMTFNILAQTYCVKKYYWYCPDYGLTWEYRKEKLLDIFAKKNPDILCLQELEQSAYVDHLKEELSDVYESLHMNRPGTKPDGCGLFYNKNKYFLV